MDKLIEAGEVLRQAKFFIDDSPGQGMLRIAANARRLKLRHGIRAVFIDYLQLIEPDNRRDSRQEQVAQISRRLKFLAKELEYPGRRPGPGQPRPGGPAGPQAAARGPARVGVDRARCRHRLAPAPARDVRTRPARGLVEVIIGKQRNGPTGEVTLTYIKQFMRFENFEMGHPFEG